MSKPTQTDRKMSALQPTADTSAGEQPPNYTNHLIGFAVRRRFADIHLGPKLAAQVYGPRPAD